jgi:hypothetical protein
MIKKAHPPKAFPFQYFVLTDIDDPSVEVECGFWDSKHDMRSFIGGYIEVLAKDDLAIVWKDHTSSGNAGRPPKAPKVEIKADRTEILHIYTKTGFPGLMNLPRPAAAPLPPQRPMPRPTEIAPESARTRPSQAAPPARPHQRITIKALADLHIECFRESRRILNAIRASSQGEDQSIPGDLNSLLPVIFRSLVDTAVSRGLAGPGTPDSGLALVETLSNHDRLIQDISGRIRGNDADLNKLAAVLHLIEKGKSWRDASEDILVQILKLDLESITPAA